MTFKEDVHCQGLKTKS